MTATGCDEFNPMMRMTIITRPTSLNIQSWLKLKPQDQKNVKLPKKYSRSDWTKIELAGSC